MTVIGTIGRLIVVPIAFVISAAVAITVMLSLGLERMTQAMAGDEFDPTNVSSLWILLESGVALTSALSLIPTLLVIIVGEVARIRSALYYTIGGGAALAISPLLMSAVQIGSASSSTIVALQVMATAGFCGGFLYWLLAGRSA